MNCIKDSHHLLLSLFQTCSKFSDPQDPSSSLPFFEPVPPPAASPTNRSILYLEIVILLVTLGVFLVSKFRKKSERLGVAEPTTGPQRKIMLASFFPGLPNFINGFYTLYRLKKDGTKLLDEIHTKGGGLFEIPVGTGTALVVTDPPIAQKILSSSNPLHLNKAREVYDVVFPSAFQDGLVVSEYGLWSTHRKILNRCFTYKSLQSYLPFMNEHGKNLVGKLLALCTTETEDSVPTKEFNELIWSETVKVILQTILGTDCCSDEESKNIHENFKIAKTIVQHRFMNPLLLVEPIWRFHPKKKELDQSIHSLSAYATTLINKYREEWQSENGQILELNANPNEGEDANDVGEKKFRCMMEEMLRSGASDKEIFDEMGTLVSTGHETTTLAIELLLFHLALNPDYQALCRDELDNLLDPNLLLDPNYNLTMDDLHNLNYLERCIYESLRLTTTTPVFFRRLDAPLKIDEGLTLPKGKSILFVPWSVHRDPKNYINPEVFDPDRFLPENVKQRLPCAFMPFSSGPRNCIGFKFAIMEIKVIAGWILRNFDIYTKDRLEDIKFFIELTLIPERQLSIILKKRKTLALDG